MLNDLQILSYLISASHNLSSAKHIANISNFSDL